MSTKNVLVGFLGGSGLQALGSATQDENKENIPSSINPKFDHFPWGNPSSLPVTKTLAGRKAVFINRHGPGHQIPPHKVDYRANIAALKQAGVTDIVAFCAVGSLTYDYMPGTFVLVDQYIDRTKARINTFFEDHGVVAHVSLADPTCKRLTETVKKAAAEIPDLVMKTGGIVVCIDGPQFSTRAEAAAYIKAGANIVGMTTWSEARLAREAGMCFANVAMITDLDCFDPERPHVTSDEVIGTMHKNGNFAAKLTEAVMKVQEEQARPDCTHGCDTAIKTAVATMGELTDEKNALDKYRILNAEVFAEKR